MKDIKVYYMEDDGGNSLVTPVDEEITEKQHEVLKYFKYTHGIESVKVRIG